MRGRTLVVLIAVSACSRTPAEHSTQVTPIEPNAPTALSSDAVTPPDAPLGAQQGAESGNQRSCDAARKAIEARRLQGWYGLPAGCSPEALLGIPLDNTWGQRRLGSDFEPVQSRLLNLAGYYRPMASVRDGVVVMFDAMNPELGGGWGPLAAELGTAEITLDWWYGTVAMPGGERVYASRGITLFTNRAGDGVLHVALYVPTSVDTYLQALRPNLKKTLTPQK